MKKEGGLKKNSNFHLSLVLSLKINQDQGNESLSLDYETTTEILVLAPVSAVQK